MFCRATPRSHLDLFYSLPLCNAYHNFLKPIPKFQSANYIIKSFLIIFTVYLRLFVYSLRQRMNKNGFLYAATLKSSATLTKFKRE